MLDRRRLDGDDLEAEIAWHQAEIVRLRSVQRDRADALLLRAIFQAIGAAVFTVIDVFACAPLRPELAAALAGLTRNRLGRRLMRVTNVPLGGLVVQLVERSNRGRVYAIVLRHHGASVDVADGA